MCQQGCANVCVCVCVCVCVFVCCVCVWVGVLDFFITETICQVTTQLKFVY